MSNPSRVKIKNSTIMGSIIGLLLISSFVVTNLLFNNQAYATLEDNDNMIANSIKKACPTYEGSSNIKDSLITLYTPAKVMRNHIHHQTQIIIY